MGLGGKLSHSVGSAGNVPDRDRSEDRQGRVAPSVAGQRRRRTGGLLTTAGGLLFAGDAGGNFVARDAKTGKPLWHSRIGSTSNAPQTYTVDGQQHVLVAVNDTLYAFALY